MLLAKLDPEKRTLVYVIAGHSPAFILGSDGAVKSELRRTGMPLGVMRDAEYTVSKPLRLAKGDVLVLLTDGLEETTNPEGELFGVDRILQAVHQNRQSKAAKIVESVFETLKDFSGNGEQVDDLTMFVAKAE